MLVDELDLHMGAPAGLRVAKAPHPRPCRIEAAELAVATNPAGVHRRPSVGAPIGDAYEAEESGAVAAVAADILDSPTAPLALDLAPARAAGDLYPIEIARIAFTTPAHTGTQH